MINRNVKYKYRDYINLSESEDKRYELIDGELFVVPSPTPMHQDIAGNLFSALKEFVLTGGLGKVFTAPLDVVLSDEVVLQPDVIYISRDRLSIVTDRNIRGAPDLVVEVLSPSTAERDRTIKRARYLRFGVRELWIVDPEARSIEVLRAGDTEFETVRVYSEGSAARSTVLEDLQVDVTRIFS